jgi:hypothetical protein
MKKDLLFIFLVLTFSINGFSQTETETYITSGNFTVPNGTTNVSVEAWGGGGGSGGHGGTGVTAGGNGGASSFTAIISAGGGGGSAGATNNTPTTGAAGGISTAGTTTIDGSPGTIGSTNASQNSTGGDGGSSPNGGGTATGSNATGNGTSLNGTIGNIPGGGAGGSSRSTNPGQSAQRRSTGGGGGGAYAAGPVSGLTPGNSISAVVGEGGNAGAGNQASGGAGGRGEIKVSWDCVNNLTSGIGTNFQTLCFNSPIVTITYELRGGRNTPTVTGLPAGVTSSFNANTAVLSISGSPTTAGIYNYSVTQVTPCAVSFTGTITVNEDSVAGTVVGNQTICYGQNPSNDLTLSGNDGNVVKWEKSESSDFSNSTDVNVTSTTLTAAQIGTLFNTTYFRAVVQNGTCNEDISNVVSITIENTSWNGTSWTNGTPSACKKVLINDGGTFSTSGTSITAATLTISNGSSFTISSTDFVELEGSLLVELGSTFTVSNNSNLIQNNNTINQGTINVTRQSAPLMRLDYIIWSAPVAGQNLLTFSPQTVTNRFYIYNPSTNLYNVITPVSNNFETGTGYLIRMPNNHPTSPTVWSGTFTGVPNNGDVNITVVDDTYNAIGNPYPSTIDADEFITTNNLSEALYFWRKTNNAASSSYATYTLAGGAGTDFNSGDPLELVPNGVIQVGQGFIAKSTSTQFVFNNSMRLHNTQNQFLRTANIDKSRIWINLNGDNNFFHQTMIAYIPGTSLGEDAGFDGKYFNDSQNAISSLIDGVEYAVQARGNFDVLDVVYLSFKTQTAGQFSLSLGSFDGIFTGTQEIILKDLLTGIDHDIKNSTYTFSSDAGVFNERFQIVYINETLGINDNPNDNAIVFVQNKNLQIDAGQREIELVNVFDLSGRKIISKNFTNNTRVELNLSGLTRQTLLVQFRTTDGAVISKKVIL